MPATILEVHTPYHNFLSSKFTILKIYLPTLKAPTKGHMVQNTCYQKGSHWQHLGKGISFAYQISIDCCLQDVSH